MGFRPRASAISGHGDLVENSVGEERVRNRELTQRGRGKKVVGEGGFGDREIQSAWT